MFSGRARCSQVSISTQRHSHADTHFSDVSDYAALATFVDNPDLYTYSVSAVSSPPSLSSPHQTHSQRKGWWQRFRREKSQSDTPSPSLHSLSLKFKSSTLRRSASLQTTRTLQRSDTLLTDSTAVNLVPHSIAADPTTSAPRTATTRTRKLVSFFTRPSQPLSNPQSQTTHKPPPPAKRRARFLNFFSSTENSNSVSNSFSLSLSKKTNEKKKSSSSLRNSKSSSTLRNSKSSSTLEDAAKSKSSKPKSNEYKDSTSTRKRQHHHHHHHHQHYHHGSHARISKRSLRMEDNSGNQGWVNYLATSVWSIMGYGEDQALTSSAANQTSASASASASSPIRPLPVTAASSPISTSSPQDSPPVSSYIPGPIPPYRPKVAQSEASSEYDLDDASSVSSVSEGVPSSETVPSLPPRTPIKLVGRRSDVSPIVTKNLAEQLRFHLPPLQRESVSWTLLYSLEQHGISLNTLYLRAAHRGPALLAIKDQSGSVFGGFVTEPFETRVGYYGTGQCFLFRGMKIETKEMERSDGAVTAEDEDKDGEEKRQVEVFHATGDNEYLIHAEAGFIAMGGGDGVFGLWLDQDLFNGHSTPCRTFRNPILSTGESFTCVGLELWAFSL